MTLLCGFTFTSNFNVYYKYVAHRDKILLPSAYAVEVMFSSCVCVCVCVCLSVCVCSSYNFWSSWHSLSIKYQDHRVKAKVISWKMLILLSGHQFNLVWLVWGQGHTKVKVISRSNCKCLTFYQQVGGGHSTERHSSLLVFSSVLLFETRYNIFI